MVLLKNRDVHHNVDTCVVGGGAAKHPEQRQNYTTLNATGEVPNIFQYIAFLFCLCWRADWLKMNIFTSNFRCAECDCAELFFIIFLSVFFSLNWYSHCAVNNGLEWKVTQKWRFHRKEMCYSCYYQWELVGVRKQVVYIISQYEKPCAQ